MFFLLRRGRLLVFGGALVVAACDTGGPASLRSSEPAPMEGSAKASPRRVRRLSDVELDNVITDLSGGRRPPRSRAMVPDSRVDGYDVDDTFLVTDPKLDGYLE